MVERALAGEPIEIHGDGTQTRCFCHVADAIRALHGLLEDGSTTGEIFNVGSTESIRIRDLADRIRAAAGSDSELVFVPYDEIYRHGIVEEMLHRIPSIDKVGAAVGWAPTLSHLSALALSMRMADGSWRGWYVPRISMNRPSRGERLSAATTR